MTATLFDAGDPVPRSTLAQCPACGADLHSPIERKEARCRRCIALGAEALTIDQAIAEVTTDLACAEGMHRLCDTAGCACPCHRDGWGREPTPREAHRQRCGGVIMAPVFGIGRRSCGVCDWSPDD